MIKADNERLQHSFILQTLRINIHRKKAYIHTKVKMESKLKKKKRKRERPDTMDYEEALSDPAWENEVRWADIIMTSNRRLGLGYFKLDRMTKGEGSCFPIAILQQLNREEVFGYLREDLRQLARSMDYHLMRQRVKDFVCILKWNHCKVQELKNFFYIDQAARAAAGEETKTWEEYWEGMLVPNGLPVRK